MCCSSIYSRPNLGTVVDVPHTVVVNLPLLLDILQFCRNRWQGLYLAQMSVLPIPSQTAAVVASASNAGGTGFDFQCLPHARLITRTTAIAFILQNRPWAKTIVKTLLQMNESVHCPTENYQRHAQKEKAFFFHSYIPLAPAKWLNMTLLKRIEAIYKT